MKKLYNPNLVIYPVFSCNDSGIIIFYIEKSKSNFGYLDQLIEGESAMSNLVNATDTTFEAEVLNAELPVLVDFWADWCAPCRMITPIVEAAAEEYAGKIKVVKLDVQNNQDTAVKFQIRGIPALMIFKNGEIVAQHVGALNKAQLTQFIDNNL